MKTTKAIVLIVLAFIIANLLSSAGLEIVTHSPYGSAGYRDGVVTASPTITIPIYREK